MEMRSPPVPALQLGGAQVARQPHEDGQRHETRQRPHQTDEPRHHLISAPASHAVSPFP